MKGTRHILLVLQHMQQNHPSSCSGAAQPQRGRSFCVDGCCRCLQEGIHCVPVSAVSLWSHWCNRHHLCPLDCFFRLWCLLGDTAKRGGKKENKSGRTTLYQHCYIGPDSIMFCDHTHFFCLFLDTYSTFLTEIEILYFKYTGKIVEWAGVNIMVSFSLTPKNDHKRHLFQYALREWTVLVCSGYFWELSPE